MAVPVGYALSGDIFDSIGKLYLYPFNVHVVRLEIKGTFDIVICYFIYCDPVFIGALYCLRIKK